MPNHIVSTDLSTLFTMYWVKYGKIAGKLQSKMNSTEFRKIYCHKTVPEKQRSWESYYAVCVSDKDVSDFTHCYLMPTTDHTPLCLRCHVRLTVHHRLVDWLHFVALRRRCEIPQNTRHNMGNNTSILDRLFCFLLCARRRRHLTA